jgi:hypothetical protein
MDATRREVLVLIVGGVAHDHGGGLCVLEAKHVGAAEHHHHHLGHLRYASAHDLGIVRLSATCALEHRGEF